MRESSATTVAFYLPQYHSIPENDEWWGPGFTDWVSVRMAEPLFDGHYQPHVVADLGEYSLLEPEARARQAELASTHRIDAFCYYHYWFEGRRLLERPFEEVLASGRPDMPFCLCWANEDWTREWSGSGEVLIRQTYSPADDYEHGRWLSRAFRDERYLRVEGRAVILVYRAWSLPDPARTAHMWRAVAKAEGAGDLMLCAVESSRRERGDPRSIGFDAAVEFQPDWSRARPSLGRRVADRLGKASRLPVDLRPRFTRFRYEDLMEAALRRSESDFPRFRCAMPGWDNTPRRQRNAIIIDRGTPELYGRWVAAIAATGPPLLFVNAWNEWAEGCHLEPCARWGTRYLQAHAEALQRAG